MGTAAADAARSDLGMVRARGACRRTRSPLSRRKNSRRAGPPGHVVRRLVEPTAGAQVEWVVTAGAGAAKEGGTAEPPPAAFVPPAMSAGGRWWPRDDPQEGTGPCRT